MGLDLSHGDFSCGYGGFFVFRRDICRAAGGGYTMEKWWLGKGYSRESHPGLCALMSHSDCDGNIDPEVCTQIADELEDLQVEWSPRTASLLKYFVESCRLAAAADEPLKFI